MTLINQTHLNLHTMSQEELVNARGFAETRITHALEDIAKLNGELACRATVEFEPVQMTIQELDNTVRY